MMSLQLARNLLCQKCISELSISDGCQPKSQLLIQPANNATLMDVDRHKTPRKKKKAGHVHAEDLSHDFQEHGVFVWYVMTSKVFSKSFSNIFLFSNIFQNLKEHQKSEIDICHQRSLVIGSLAPRWSIFHQTLGTLYVLIVPTVVAKLFHVLTW